MDPQYPFVVGAAAATVDHGSEIVDRKKLRVLSDTYFVYEGLKYNYFKSYQTDVLRSR